LQLEGVYSVLPTPFQSNGDLDEPSRQVDGRVGVVPGTTTIRKEVLLRRGALTSATTRAPGPVLDQGTRAALDRLMKWSESLMREP